MKMSLKGGNPVTLLASMKKNFDKFFVSCTNIEANEVNTWEDFIVSNMAFLYSLYLPTYHRGFLQHGGQNKLLKLHELGVFTHGGQGSDCDEYYREKKVDYLEKPFLEGIFYYYDIEYFENIQKLLKSLSTDPRIFITYYDGINDTMFDNFVYVNKRRGREFYNITRSGNFLASNLRKNRTKKEYIDMINDAIIGFMPFLERNAMLKKCVFFTIVLRKYCSDVFADQLLLEHMNKLNFPIKVKDDIIELFHSRGGDE
jgi:hypothetical protein